LGIGEMRIGEVGIGEMGIGKVNAIGELGICDIAKLVPLANWELAIWELAKW